MNKPSAIITILNKVSCENDSNPTKIVEWLEKHPGQLKLAMDEYNNNNTGRMGDSVLVALSMMK